MVLARHLLRSLTFSNPSFRAHFGSAKECQLGLDLGCELSSLQFCRCALGIPKDCPFESCTGNPPRDWRPQLKLTNLNELQVPLCSTQSQYDNAGQLILPLTSYGQAVKTEKLHTFLHYPLPHPVEWWAGSAPGSPSEPETGFAWSIIKIKKKKRAVSLRM